MLRIFCLFFLLFLMVDICISQVTEEKNWCASQCNAAGDEKGNTKRLCKEIEHNRALGRVLEGKKQLIPLRIGFVQRDTSETEVTKELVQNAVNNLNKSFVKTNLLFYVDRIDVICSEIKLEELSQNGYKVYDAFSKAYDLPNTISIFVFDFDEEFCRVDGNSVSCGRTGGFSYVLSDKTSNIVLSKFDLSEIKVIAHEMGHFWGLYHTFEEFQFGKDNFDHSQCHLVGDLVCDTPPDPGPIYEIYVNYTACELMNFVDIDGNKYKPLIQNFMSYYKPCYLQEYSFTDDQVNVINTALTQPMRAKYARDL